MPIGNADEGETMTWYKVTLSSADISAGRQVEMEDAFYGLFVKSESPKEAGVGMFSLIDDTQYVFYFSPGAAQLAMPLINAYGGVPCEAPRRSDVRVLWAHSEGLDTFPFAPGD
jgi:hypothetical protein